MNPPDDRDTGRINRLPSLWSIPPGDLTVTIPAGTVLKVADKAEDHTLRKMADRIQARAIRRCGELLREIKPSKGGRPPEKLGGTPPLVSRAQAAKDAGLSSDQRKQALRVANVPSEDFEAAIESNAPPTITALAEREGERDASLPCRDRGGSDRLCHLAQSASPPHDPRATGDGGGARPGPPRPAGEGAAEGIWEDSWAWQGTGSGKFTGTYLW